MIRHRNYERISQLFPLKIRANERVRGCKRMICRNYERFRAMLRKDRTCTSYPLQELRQFLPTQVNIRTTPRFLIERKEDFHLRIKHQRAASLKKYCSRYSSVTEVLCTILLQPVTVMCRALQIIPVRRPPS